MNDTNKATKKHNRKNRNIALRKSLRQEIDNLRTKVRAAYSLEAQINVCDYKPTEEELEIISEKNFNTKLLEKFETIYFSDKKPDNRPRDEFYFDREHLTLLNFFYLVRLAQQGFLYLISGAYPDLEPEAIIYLCDKMVGASVFAERTSHTPDKLAYRNVAYGLMRDLIQEKEKPVAEGFKTTFKQIMDLVQSLIYRSIDPKENDSQKSNASIIPAMWVIMPEVSMMDNKTFAVPGAIPTLPFPASILSTLTTQQNTFPSAAEDLKKQVELLKQKRRDVRKESEAKKIDEKKLAADKLAVKELAAKELATKEINGEVQVQENVQTDEDEDTEDDEEEDEEEFDEHDDDRFADADSSDEYEQDEPTSAQTSIKEAPTTPDVTEMSTSPKATVKTTPVEHIPVKTAPVKTAPVKTAPVKTAPVKAAPVKTTPSKTAPVATASVETAPVETAPVATTPVAAAPVLAAPVSTTPEISKQTSDPEISKANSSWLNFAAKSPAVETTSGPNSPRDNNRGNKAYHSIPKY